ncbi:hypothetical protein D3C85_1166780 [compost metagenome]
MSRASCFRNRRAGMAEPGLMCLLSALVVIWPTVPVFVVAACDLGRPTTRLLRLGVLHALFQRLRHLQMLLKLGQHFRGELLHLGVLGLVRRFLE